MCLLVTTGLEDRLQEITVDQPVGLILRQHHLSDKVVVAAAD
jgi:hypothetical protein